LEGSKAAKELTLERTAKANEICEGTVGQFGGVTPTLSEEPSAYNFFVG
jgi:hypothetical protein